MKILGFTESRTDCECCGRQDLKGTYAMDDELGNILYFGVICGAKAAGWSSVEFKENWKGVKKEIKMAAIREQKNAWREYMKLLAHKLKPDRCNEDELYVTYAKAIKELQLKYPTAWKSIYSKDLRNI